MIDVANGRSCVDASVFVDRQDFFQAGITLLVRSQSNWRGDLRRRGRIMASGKSGQMLWLDDIWRILDTNAMYVKVGRLVRAGDLGQTGWCRHFGHLQY